MLFRSLYFINLSKINVFKWWTNTGKVPKLNILHGSIPVLLKCVHSSSLQLATKLSHIKTISIYIGGPGFSCATPLLKYFTGFNLYFFLNYM